MLSKKANVTGALYSSVEIIMKLTGVQVSLLLSRDMHSSHLCNESQYACDEHIIETTETEATVCQSLSTKMQHLGSLIYYPF